MPIVNGQKMACEPCIRGHRSTKCAHGGDRMLVPVRKPGRPLSTCPHPPGKSCQCRSVTAAIPKGGTCRCGSSQGAKSNGTPTLVKAEPPDNAPLSPTKQASFRVQKPTPKPSRKQSSDASAALQRMDSNNLNLQNGANEYLASSTNGVASSNWGSFVSPLQNGANPYSTYPSMTSRLEGALDSSVVHMNGGLDIVPNLSSGNGISDHSTVSSGTLTPGTSDSPYHTPTSSNGEPSQELSLETPGSCCSQRTQQPPQVPNRMQFQGQQLQSGPRESPNMMGYAPQVPLGNGHMMEQVSAQVSVNQQLYPVNHYTQPELYSDHLSFGTPQLPLQQAQWEQLMANFLPQSGSNGGPSYTNHVCDCGPGCECLGCASHPYNQVSIQYVREAMALQESLGNANIDTPTPIADPPLAVGEASPPPSHSPAETDSPGANELNLSPSEFLFVDYGSGMCGCGDDCACVNCLIHRDPLDHKMAGHGIGGLHDKTPN